MGSNWSIDEAKEFFKAFKGKPFREHQREAIEFIRDSDKQVVVVEAPTGSGKSLIGAVTSKLYNDSIYLVHSKPLQDQLYADFPEFSILKGRANYPCHDNTSIKCDACPYEKSVDCVFGNPADKKDLGELYCEYLAAKDAAIRNPLAVLNYTYFLIESNFVGKFAGRKLVVCDEADMLETELLNFIKINISQYHLDRFGIDRPKYVTTSSVHSIGEWKAWAGEVKKKVEWKRDKLEALGQLFKKEADQIKAFLTKINIFESFVDESWLFEQSGTEGDEKWEFKPTWLTEEMTYEYFRNKVAEDGKIVLLSATLPHPNVLATCLGIPTHEFDYLELPTNFPPSNRPIHLCNTANMANKHREESLPLIKAKIKKILAAHPNEKGLIHTTSYKLVEEIFRIDQRIMMHSSKDREAKLSLFKESPHPHVMISPSMDRGISLHEDLCRFIIIVNSPNPNLGDKQVKARLYGSGGMGEYWYASMSAQTIEQQIGRGVRSKTDRCRVYILDTQISNALNRNPTLFSQYFRDCIVFGDV